MSVVWAFSGTLLNVIHEYMQRVVKCELGVKELTTIKNGL
jgi:hypothetical protein